MIYPTKIKKRTDSRYNCLTGGKRAKLVAAKPLIEIDSDKQLLLLPRGWQSGKILHTHKVRCRQGEQKRIKRLSLNNWGAVE